MLREYLDRTTLWAIQLSSVARATQNVCMTLEIFSRAHLRRIAEAIGGNSAISHAAISNLWIEFGDDVDIADGTKMDRANKMISQIGKEEDADRKLLELVNETFYASPQAEWRHKEASFAKMRESLKNSGFTETTTGFTFPERFPAQPKQVQAPVVAPKEQHMQSNDNLPVHKFATVELGSKPYARNVFIVHGRDMDNKEALCQLLRKMDIRPISWTQASEAAKSQNTLDIVEAGMQMAQAVIVLFTPDDLAMLNQKFHAPSDGPDERQPTGQARPNVILEAGMAYAKAPDRTIFARVGTLRGISDIAGLNWINLDQTYDSRHRLRASLRKARVELDQDSNITAPDAGLFIDHFPITT